MIKSKLYLIKFYWSPIFKRLIIIKSIFLVQIERNLLILLRINSHD